MSAANVAEFREQFRSEAFSNFRPPAAEHVASAAARRTEPGSAEELVAEIAARAKGTQAQRRAAVEARNAEFKAGFEQASRSSFAEGNREAVTRALKAREEERAGLRVPNRGI